MPSQDDRRSSGSKRRRDEDEDDDEIDIEIVPVSQAAAEGVDGDHITGIQRQDGLDDRNDVSPPLSPRLSSFLAPVTDITHNRSFAPLSPQTDSFRLTIRQKYAELINHTRTDQHIVDNEEGLSRGIAMMNQLNKASCHITEELQDAEEMALLASKGHEKAKRHLDHEMSVSLDDYLAGIQRNYMAKDGEMEWIKLGEAAAQIHAVYHITSFMNQVFSYQHEHKVKQKRGPREKDELKAASAADKTASATDEEEQAAQTSRRIAHLRQLLGSYKTPIMLWEFLLDPHSFVRTVENLFDFSFLMKEEITMTYEAWDTHTAFPYITYKERPRKQQRENKEAEEKEKEADQEEKENTSFLSSSSSSSISTSPIVQCTPTIDYPRWYGLVSALGITKAAINHDEMNKQQRQERIQEHKNQRKTQQERKKHTETAVIEEKKEAADEENEYQEAKEESSSEIEHSNHMGSLDTQSEEMDAVDDNDGEEEEKEADLSRDDDIGPQEEVLDLESDED